VGSHALIDLLSRRGRPLVTELAPDARVLAFTIAAAVLCALIFGPAPAWRAVRVDPNDALRAGGRGIAEGHSRFHLGNSLIVAQLSLALVMTAATGLLVGSWQRLTTLDPGFESEGVALVRVNTRAAAIPGEQVGATYRRILERIRALPGVRYASAADRTPIGSTSWTAEIETPTASTLSQAARTASLNEVSEQYFATMGIRLVSGRDFDHSDLPHARPVAIVNAEFARRYFGTTSPLGKSFTIRWDHPVTYDAVGVVADTKDEQLWEEAIPIAYFPLTQDAGPEPYLNFIARGMGDPSGLLPEMRAAIMEAHPRIALTSTTLRAQMNDSLRLQRTLGVLSAFCTGLALLLASIGLYGLMAYSVARRRNEIGVRIALGANRARILRMVLGDVSRLLFAGLLIGGTVAFATQRLMSSFLFGLRPGDPATMAASALALVLVALLAAVLPAWRAARLDPLTTLREN
jgi:predicted permease